MPIKFAVKIVRLKVYVIVASPLTLTLLKVTSGSELDKFLIYTIIVINWTT